MPTIPSPPSPAVRNIAHRVMSKGELALTSCSSQESRVESGLSVGVWESQPCHLTSLRCHEYTVVRVDAFPTSSLMICITQEKCPRGHDSREAAPTQESRPCTLPRKHMAGALMSRPQGLE